MKMLARIVKNADGQVLVLFALLMVVIMGFAALVVDAGAAYNARAKLQKAADAAALAGAQDLTNVDDAVKTAVEYTKENGLNVLIKNIVPVVPSKKYEASGDTGTDLVTVTIDDQSRIKVACTTTVKYSFAGVLGGKFKEADISASAVAKRESQWDGEALPFINLDYDYSTTDPIAWTHVGSGIKGTVLDFYIQGSGSNTYFEIEYANGITVKPGFSNGVKSILDGDDKLKDGLDDLLTPEDENVKKLYLFSLRANIIKSGKFTVNGGHTIYLNNLSKLKNGDIIDPEQLVLIEVLFLGCDNYNNQHNIDLKYLGNVFDLGNNNPDEPLPDFPTEHLSSTGGVPSLVE